MLIAIVTTRAYHLLSKLMGLTCRGAITQRSTDAVPREEGRIRGFGVQNHLSSRSGKKKVADQKSFRMIKFAVIKRQS